jgi:hypothetical protein
LRKNKSNGLGKERVLVTFVRYSIFRGHNIMHSLRQYFPCHLQCLLTAEAFFHTKVHYICEPEECKSPYHVRHPFPSNLLPQHLCSQNISQFVSNSRLCSPTLIESITKVTIMSPISFLSTLFLAPCFRSEPRSPPQHTYNRTIECNQYERRLYLRPIMPPTTRRQSRLLGEGDLPDVPLVESRRSSKSESRKGSNAKKENVEVDQNLERKQSSVNFDVPVQREDEKMEDATGDVAMEDVEVLGSASSLKERTLSMEMNDAIQALHRDEEEDDGDDQAYVEDDEDDEQPTWSEEEDDDVDEDTQAPHSKDKKEGEDIQALYDEYDDEEDELPTWSDEDDEDDGDSKGDEDDIEIDAEFEDEVEDEEGPLPDEDKGAGNTSTQFNKSVS